MSKKISILAGILLSIAGLVYAFNDLNIHEIWNSLKSVNIPLVILSTVVMVYSVWLRAHRWRLIVMPFKEVKTSVLFGSSMIGYFGNGVLPLRMGEILKGVSLWQKEQISRSTIFGTIILERILDFAGLVVVLIVFMLAYPTTKTLGFVLYAIIFVTIAVMVFIIWLGQTTIPWESWGNRFSILQSRGGKRLWEILERIVESIVSIRKTHHALEMTALTLIIWLLYYGYIFVLVIAMDMSLGWIPVGIILIATTLSISIPSAPGYIGTYHAVVVAVMVEMFGANLHDSQAFSVILHAVGYIPFIVIGAYYFVHNSIHLADVKKSHD